ncbi:uncharacterized protein [Mytilus edulis]|uniref:uncharacterized protein n=1 Tax=Mytilus edulis TaxID=6550 RepID=UPI0039EE1A32
MNCIYSRYCCIVGQSVISSFIEGITVLLTQIKEIKMKFALLMLVFLVIATDNVRSQCPTCDCPPFQVPVCSRNGFTFQNECFVRCHLQTVACRGVCPCPTF